MMGVISAYDSKIADSSFIAHKELMKDFYEHPPAALKGFLRERRTNHSLLHCPYCGNPVSPDTLDHFIPKGTWPEFAILNNNLVPQCRECAPIKGERYVCPDTSGALFLHPFYTEILNKVGFQIKVNFDVSSKLISYEPSIRRLGALDDEDAIRASRHVNTLQIQKRIKLFCRRKMKSWTNRLKDRRFDIRLALKLRLEEVENNHDWKTALYIGVLENEDLCNYLNSLSPSITPDTAITDQGEL